jgi:hypothetical protein
MGPNPADLEAAVTRIVAIRIGIQPESEYREEAEAIMIATVPVMIAIPVTISHPHSSHLVLLESTRRKICSHGHHAAVAHTAAVAEAAAHMCAGRRHKADAERGRGNKSDSCCPKHGILLNKIAWCLTARRETREGPAFAQWHSRQSMPALKSLTCRACWLALEIAQIWRLIAWSFRWAPAGFQEPAHLLNATAWRGRTRQRPLAQWRRIETIAAMRIKPGLAGPGSSGSD